MIFRCLTYLLLFLLSVPSTHSRHSLSNQLTLHSQDFNVVANSDGVPQLELGDKPAPDPENVLDTRNPHLRPSRLDPSDPPPFEIPSASSEFFDGEIDDPLAPPREPPKTDELVESSTEPPTPTPTPPHQGKLDIDIIPDDASQPEQIHTSEPVVTVHASSSTPSREPTNTSDPTRSPSHSPRPVDSNIPRLTPLPSSAASTVSASPLPSRIAASPTPQVISVSVRPQPSRAPMVAITVSSPFPTVSRDPAPTSHQVTDDASPSPSPTMPAAERSSPSPSVHTAAVSNPPEISARPSFMVSPSPSFGRQQSVSAMPSTSNIPSRSPSYTPSPSVSVARVVSGDPSPSQEAGPSVYPSPSPGNNHASGHPSITVIPANHDAEEPPLSTPSDTVSIPLSASSPPEVSITVNDDSKGPALSDLQGTAEISPQITVVLPVPPSPAESPAAVASPVLPMPPSQSANPVPGGSPTTADEFPVSSPDADDIAFLQGPDGDFTCVYFGIGQFPEFLNPEPSSLSGTVAQFSVPQNNFPNLAPQYLSHTFGESWSYSVPVDAGVPYEFVLAFAEVYDVACEAGPGFRNFIASVEDQSITVDVIAEVGCGVVLKKGYDDVISSTGVIEVSLQGISQNALLSTLCYKPVSNVPSSPLPSPAVPSSSPMAPLLSSPEPSPSSVAVLLPSPLPSTTVTALSPSPTTAATLSPSPTTAATLSPSPTAVSVSSPLATAAATLSPSTTAAAVLSPSPSSSTTEAGAEVISPGEQYQCVNFGPKAIDGFALFDPTSISGEVSVYSGPTVVEMSASFPTAYLTHVFGQEWTYFLNVGTASSQNVVLGFAEVFTGACDAGSGFRTFTVSIAGDSRFLDIIESAGCGVVEQIAFDDVNPVSGIIEIAFSSISNQAMLSVLCFKDADMASTSPAVTPAPTGTAVASTPASPTPSSSPLIVAIPPAISPSISPIGLPSPNLSPSPVPPASPSTSAGATQLPLEEERRTCFNFGEDPVEGFFNIPPPSPESGVSFFNNPLAVVQGTLFSSVYASHIFGSKFTFSVATGSLAIKSVELGFAEVFEPGCFQGFRVFTIEIGSISRSVDVFDEAGCSTALDIRLDGVVPSELGVIDVAFTAVENFAMVSAICIIENNAGDILQSKVAFEGALMDANGNSIASVNTNQSEESPNPPSSPFFSGGTSPLPATPSPSLFPKENGVIIVGSSTDIDSPDTTIIVGPGLPFEDIGDPGAEDTPTPTSILVPANLTSATMGSGGSPPPPPSSIQVNPSASSTPDGNAALAVVIEAPNELPSQTSSVTPSLLPSAAPTQTPPFSSPFSPPPAAILPVDSDQAGSGDDEDSDWDESGIPSPVVIGNEEPTAVPPIPVGPSIVPDISPSASGGTITAISGSMQPSGSASPSVSFASGVSLSIPDATLNPSNSPSGGLTINSENEQPEYSMELDSESINFSPEAAVTAVAPVPTSIGDVDTANPDSSGGVSLGIDQEAILGESIAPSPANTSMVQPPLIDDRQPLLPPVDPPLPSPSALPALPGSPSPEDGPTVTPTPIVAVAVTPAPSVSASAAASVELVPVTSGSAQMGESPLEPSPVPDVPTLPLPGDIDSSNAPSSNSEGQGEADPTPSQVSSATGANEVIIESTETPSPIPVQSASSPDPAPPKPVTSVPENSTGAIGVPEGTVIESDGENNDLTGDGDDDEGPTIVAGPFIDLIRTQPEGNGFTIGMGVFGGLLVGLLLVCLFFAIFRGRGGSYSYSSQYSAHKPADYDPSQGGYTDDLGLGPGQAGNDSMYGEGQTMYNGGEGTFDSRQKPKDGSFTYEGAGDGLGGAVGSVYGAEPQDDGPGPEGTSAYDHMQPDRFNEYTSLNVQGDSGMGKSQGANSVGYTVNDTITMPNTGLYSGSRTDGDRLTNLGDEITAASSRLEYRASDSFNAYHSIARPMAHESESSGKQERTMESFAFGGGPWAPHGNNPVDDEEYNEDTRDSRAQSMSSTPSAAPSPYEQSMHVRVADENLGNVVKGNPKVSRTTLTRSFLAPVAREAMRTSGRVDTEQRHDFSLLDENSAEGTGAEAAQMGNSFPRKAAASDNASNDGPWPEWWSHSKRNLVPAGTYLAERAPHSHSSHDESPGYGKENESKSSYASHGAAMDMNSQEEVAPGTMTSGLRSATPLAPSSKTNVEGDEPSHFAPDSGWLRISKTSCKAHDKVHARPNADFDELRRRRQPYVKSVANRLSVGPRSFSTSITRDSGLEQGRQEEYESEQQESNMNRGSSSWIARAPVHK